MLGGIGTAFAQSEDEEKSASDIMKKISTSNSDLNITSVSDYTKGDYFYIVGEVLNKAVEGKEFVKISATFYDEGNTVIGTAFTYTDPSEIPPGESSPFKFIINTNDVTDLNAIKSYKLMISSS